MTAPHADGRRRGAQTLGVGAFELGAKTILIAGARRRKEHVCVEQLVTLFETDASDELPTAIEPIGVAIGGLDAIAVVAAESGAQLDALGARLGHADMDRHVLGRFAIGRHFHHDRREIGRRLQHALQLEQAPLVVGLAWLDEIVTAYQPRIVIFQPIDL